MRPTGDTGDYTVALDARDGVTEVVVTALGSDEEFLNNQEMSATAVAPERVREVIGAPYLPPRRGHGAFPPREQQRQGVLAGRPRVGSLPGHSRGDRKSVV